MHVSFKTEKEQKEVIRYARKVGIMLRQRQMNFSKRHRRGLLKQRILTGKLWCLIGKPAKKPVWNVNSQPVALLM